MNRIDKVVSLFEKNDSHKSLHKQETFNVNTMDVLCGSAVIFAAALLLSIPLGLFVGGI